MNGNEKKRDWWPKCYNAVSITPHVRDELMLMEKFFSVTKIHKYFNSYINKYFENRIIIQNIWICVAK